MALPRCIDGADGVADRRSPLHTPTLCCPYRRGLLHEQSPTDACRDLRAHQVLQQAGGHPRRDAAHGLLAPQRRSAGTGRRPDPARRRTATRIGRTAPATGRSQRPGTCAARDAQAAHEGGPRRARTDQARAGQGATREGAGVARQTREPCRLSGAGCLRRPDAHRCGATRSIPRSQAHRSRAPGPARPAGAEQRRATRRGDGRDGGRAALSELSPRGGAHAPLPLVHLAEEDRRRALDFRSHAAFEARAVLGAGQRLGQGASARCGAWVSARALDHQQRPTACGA